MDTLEEEIAELKIELTKNFNIIPKLIELSAERYQVRAY